MFSLFRNIKVYFFIALVATTCYNQAQTSLSYRDRVIGCLYSDVCSDDEICFDDNAFGRCEELVEPGRPSSTYAYELDRKTLQLLGQEVARLKENGFDFKDDYAQCVLKKVLNDRPRLFYDPTACDSERVISPYVDLLITEPNAPDNTDNSAYSQPEEGQGDAVDAYLKEYGLPSNLLLKSTPQKSSSSKQTKKYLSPLSPHPSQSSPPLVSLSISPPLPKSKAANANSRVDGTPSDVKSKFSSSVNGDRDRDNGQPSGQSNGATKAKALPTKHLKRTPSLRFIGKNERQREEAREVKGGKHSDAGTGELDRSALSPEENRQLDRVVELLLTKLQSTEGAPLAELPTDDGYSRSAAEKPAAADGYDYRYAVDEDALSDGISFMGRPVTDEDVTQVLGNLDTIVEEQSAKSPAEALFRSNAPPVYRPRLYPVDVDIQDYSTAANKNDEGVVLIPLGRFFETNNRPIKPSVRVLRDTSEEAQELTVPAGRDSLEESSDLLSSLTPKDDEGIFLVDIIDKDKEDDSPDVRERERKEDEEIMEKILGEYIKKKSGINSDAVAEDISSLFDNGAESEDDDGLGRKIDVKEILFGDINYNNNFDTKKPNFYRKHRYDIKKPGPKYWEEYFFKPDSSGQSVEEEDANSSNEPVFIQPLLNQAKPPLDETPIMRKKDNSIRSNKPVSEGPVKVEAQSENTVIIRSAEVGEETNLEAVDSTHAYVITDKMLGEKDSQKFIKSLEKVFKLPRGTFSNLRKENYQLTFKVNPNYRELNASQVATQIEDFAHVIKNITGYSVKETGIGDKIHLPVVSARLIQNENLWFDLTVLIFAVVSAIITGAFLIFMWRRNAVFREKVKGFAKISEDWVNWDYQDLCRQRMKGQPGDEEKGAVNGESGKPKNVDTSLANQEKGPEVNPSPPSRSSTSSWVEEPVSSNMDITTGHVILTYMEDHLKKKDRLDQEWEALCAYEADPCSTNAANQKQNANKNRYPDVLPFDHSRVILNDLANASNSDYINANTITDHDPRNPSYIVTQGPLANTKADFWQMIWESGSVIIVMLSRLRENGLNLCDRYWPEEGSEAYQDYEVHLVSEHIWCDDYLVRSFYLKNLKTGETRTVTQFHFLSWPENGIPPNTKSILDFRRKVNKSYKGRSCPIVVHCSDGIGRTGTYILIDMVLNRLAKGAKEIDIAATLEHIRDQRSGLVKNKAQFEFVLLAIADEVQAILKALN